MKSVFIVSVTKSHLLKVHCRSEHAVFLHRFHTQSSAFRTIMPYKGIQAAPSPTPEPGQVWLTSVPGGPSVNTVSCNQPKLSVDIFARVNGPILTIMLYKGIQAAPSPTPEPGQVWLTSVPGGPSVNAVSCNQPKLSVDIFARVDGPIFMSFC